MLKQRLINGNGINNTSKTETFNEEQPINKINEWKAAAIALSLSLCVLTIKTFVTNRERIRNALWDRKYIYLESTMLPDGQVMGYYINQLTFYGNGIWLPILCGFLISAFTWLIIYYDSYQPGIQPPSPFSPTKNRRKSSSPRPEFHLGYLMAIANGVMVFLIMLARNLLNSE